MVARLNQRPPIDEQILRVDVEQTFPGDTEASGLQKLEVEGQSQAAKKLVLSLGEVGGIGVEPIRPQMRAAFGIVQLYIDPHPITNRPHTAFDDISDAELATDRLYVGRLALEGDAVLRAMTKLPEIRERSVVRSSVIPSAKYSNPGSFEKLAKGSTTIDRRGVMEAGAASPAACCARTAPTKRTPLPIVVRINRCSPPLSPMARRAALIRLARVDSETIRPPQTEASKSSLLTTRSRLPTRNTSRSNTFGSTESNAGPRRSSRRSMSRT